MSLMDLINGAYEALGGVFLLANCRALYKSKQVKGVSVTSFAFFASWGYWNLFYYSHLNQWLSFAGGLLIVSANTLWVVLALYYRKPRVAKCTRETGHFGPCNGWSCHE